MRPPRPSLPLILAALPCVVGGGVGCEPAREPLHVFAASSLQDVVRDLEVRYEAAHPTVDVVPNFAGSQQLRVQIEQGARPSVFLSADRHHVDALHAAGLVDAPRRLACNELVLVVPGQKARGEAAVDELRALPRADRLVVGAAEVPIGRYTERLFEQARARFGQRWLEAVEASVVSRELNSRQVLAKVILGEADAAIVYRTDALAAGEAVGVVPLPAELEVETSYWMARVRAQEAAGRADEESAAHEEAWMMALGGPTALERLVAHGFGACEGER